MPTAGTPMTSDPSCCCVDDDDDRRARRNSNTASASSNVLEELIECQCRIGEVAAVVELVPAPPDGGYGWVIVACAFCCNFIFDGCCYGFGVMLPALQDKFGGSNAEIAFAGALCTAVMSVEGESRTLRRRRRQGRSSRRS